MISMLFGSILLILIFLTFNIFLYFLTQLNTSQQSLLSTLNNLLPQSQCMQCDYPGCLPYAEAILQGEDITKCLPGGNETIKKIATLMGTTQLPTNHNLTNTPIHQVAFIDESACIGCKKCIDNCPSDAIIGSFGYMHTILNDECTGCELCISPCPVDCITLKSIS